MYANVKIFGGAKENTIVIPLEGLIRTGREQRVIIALGEGKFQARNVKAGIESGNYVEILQGLNENDEIVISGQFLIDSEASMRASLSRMSAPESEDMSSAKASMAKTKIVSARGIIKVVKTEEHKLTIQHEAIKILGWPSMSMDFIIADDVDISDLSDNDNVMFQLEEKNDRYRITSIHKMGKGEM